MAAELSTNLVETLEKIKEKRIILARKMDEDNTMKGSILAKIEIRSERLKKIIDRKNKRGLAKKEYEKTIMETEAAYKKILESSALLLKSLQEQEDSPFEKQFMSEHEETMKAVGAAD